MRWQTKTQIPNFPFKLYHNDKVLLMGSCFAENIGTRLQYFKYNVNLNPFGILYNPLSLANTTARMCAGKAYTEEELTFDGNLYFSFEHHSRFSDVDIHSVLGKINESFERGFQSIQEAKCVFISLGTAFYWKLKETDEVVSNCHKQPSEKFDLILAGYSEVRTAIIRIITDLRKINPAVEIVFTISPIRHLKHGSVGNNRSKSTLLLVAQELAEAVEHVHYFPSYELVVDDLRDYRFYEEDLIHPNKVAVDYVWDKFTEALINKDDLPLLNQVDKMQKLLAHRPFNNTGALHQLAQLEKKNTLFKGSGISFEEEINTWKKAHL